MYVIAGASGHTGRVAAEELLARGQKVRVLGRKLQGLLPLVGKGAEAFELDLHDAAKLEQALTGAKAAYLLIPPNFTASDFLEYQYGTADSFARAVSDSGIRYVVFLSSIGAQHAQGTGPIQGLHYAEEQLAKIENLNLLSVRAGFFMENLYTTIPVIQQYGFLGTAVAPNVRIPMISTGDIGRYVAERLQKLDFKGKEFRELLGHQDLTMIEAAEIIGEALGKPGLKFRQLDDETMRQAFAGAGISRSAADLMVELGHALSEGRVTATERRTAQNTTSTSLEEFARHQLSGAAAQVQAR